MTHLFRTRFKKEIVAEFLPPAQVLRGKKEKTSKVIIFCSGMPGVPSQRVLLESFSKKGFWAVTFRYRGSWESSGRLFKNSPHLDLLDVIDEISKGKIKDLWNKKIFRLRPKKIYVFASSFGGPAAFLASKDPRITKIVALSPVVDWRTKSRQEPLSWFARFVEEAFGEAYRIIPNGFQKLAKGDFYNPVSASARINPEKILIFHARDDTVVLYGPVARFAKKLGIELVPLKRGGHLSLRNFIESKCWKKIKNFIQS